MFRPKPILSNIEWMETQMIKSFMVIYLLRFAMDPFYDWYVRLMRARKWVSLWWGEGGGRGQG